MEKWEKYLINTKEKNYNLERLNSVKENNSKLVHEYVLRSINILNSKKIKNNIYFYVSETLKWMDVSKTGDSKVRKLWKQKGFDLFVHNEGSADIYKDEVKDYDEVVYTLIKTHGLIGQYLRGEIKLSQNKILFDLIEKKLITKDDLKEVLVLLNECIIRASSNDVYEKTKNDVNNVIDYIINNDFNHEYDLVTRFDKLNAGLSDE